MKKTDLWACTASWLAKNVLSKVGVVEEDGMEAEYDPILWPLEWPLVVVETAASMAMIIT